MYGDRTTFRRDGRVSSGGGGGGRGREEREEANKGKNPKKPAWPPRFAGARKSQVHDSCKQPNLETMKVWKSGIEMPVILLIRYLSK